MAFVSFSDAEKTIGTCTIDASALAINIARGRSISDTTRSSRTSSTCLGHGGWERARGTPVPTTLQCARLTSHHVKAFASPTGSCTRRSVCRAVATKTVNRLVWIGCWCAVSTCCRSTVSTAALAINTSCVRSTPVIDRAPSSRTSFTSVG